ncbi:MAG TPA: hypothetical protein PLI89_12020 [Chitinophagales bacterium]|nr:hypothetical protein [Chitinophagales bacterium]
MSKLSTELHQVFVDNGWLNIGSCMCGGVYREKYSKGGYIIRITMKGNWSVDNEQISGNADNLAEKLPTI